MGMTFVVLGVFCKAYASIGEIHDSTLVAMGALTLKKAAGMVGTLCLILGGMLLLIGE